MGTSFLDTSTYLELNLKECGREHCIPEKEFSFTPKTFYLFHYVTDGKGTLIEGNKVYELHAGDMFFIGPGDEPHYTPNKQDPWTYYWLGIDGSNSKPLIEMSGLSRANPVIHDEEKVYRDFFFKIYNQYISKGHFDLYCLGQAYEFINQLCGSSKVPELNLSSSESHIKEAKEFILNNFQFHITIDDVAKNVGVTPNYLANIFSRYNEDSPKQFLIDIRMKNAAILLQTGAYRINEVGKKCGYQNQLHFSNEFKRYYGVSPLAYKKEHGGQ